MTDHSFSPQPTKEEELTSPEANAAGPPSGRPPAPRRPGKVDVCVVPLGRLRHSVDLEALDVDSELFKIRVKKAAGDPLPNPHNRDAYSDTDLVNIMARALDPHREGADEILVGIIDAPLQDQYYFRRFENNRAVIAIDEIAPVLQQQHYSLDQFVLRNLYQLVATHLRFGYVMPSKTKLTHFEVRGCIYDANWNIGDIVHSLKRPVLCKEECHELARGTPLEQLIPTLNKELKRINKPLAYRVFDLVEAHPIRSAFIGAVAGIALNVLASILFEIGKNWNWFKFLGLVAPKS
jgi:hypothetical protein